MKTPYSEKQFLKGIFLVLSTTEVHHKDYLSQRRKGNKLIRYWAEYSPRKKRITLFKHDDLSGRVNSVIHELAHAIYPEKTEEEILELTDEIFEDLWTSL